MPTDLARHLTFGEALVWWGDKDRIDFGPVGLVFAAAVAILGFVSVLAPEFWLQPWSELWKPVAALLSPAALVLVRERLSQRAVLVTDVSITEIDRSGQAQRRAPAPGEALPGIPAGRAGPRRAGQGGVYAAGRRHRQGARL